MLFPESLAFHLLSTSQKGCSLFVRDVHHLMISSLHTLLCYSIILSVYKFTKPVPCITQNIQAVEELKNNSHHNKA
jgi:hypothetical protein